MFWSNESLAASEIFKWFRILFCIAIILSCIPIQANEADSDIEVWLVTYGPGEISWQRFGHNAIWIRDSDLGLDHVFNFGFFDFDQEAFYQRFLQGKLWYFSAAQPAEREFSQYIDENRSIRAQKLNLSDQQSLLLAEHLMHEIQPENRDYLYDYYTNNCSTRIRDSLDIALGGALIAGYETVQAEQTLRDHTRRLTIDDFWLYLGLEMGLGSKIDRSISQWDEFFIPSELAKAVAEYRMPGEYGDQALVAEDVMLYQSTLESAPLRPARWWPRYLLMSTLILFVAWLICVWVPVVSPLQLARVWLVLAGVVGSALVFFWFFTDHQAARLNLNLLVLNPLWWFLLAWRQNKVAGLVLLFLSLLALVMVMLPPQQYNLDVLAAFLPLNIVSGLVLLRGGWGKGPAQEPISANRSA